MKKQEMKSVAGAESDAVGKTTQSRQDAVIVVSDQFGRPAITIRPSQEYPLYDAGQRGVVGSATVARLGSLLQALPSLLTAGESSRTQLMEVVVKGDLVRAADGNGFRALAMGPKGVKEHARLFNPEKLQNVINAGAVWQVASVVVAQKHLADISKKLDTISEGVTHLSRFVDQDRKARIEGAYRYLAQAGAALEAGEIPPSVRIELEACERELLSITIHMQKQLLDGFAKVVPHAETVGTDELALNISKKIREQEMLLQDLALGIRTRICAWHVLSLFPGEPKLKEARRADLQQAVEDFGGLSTAFDSALAREILSMSSMFNSESTLERRRDALRKQTANTVLRIRETQAAATKAIDDTAGLLLKHDEPVRMLFQYTDGLLVGVSEVFS